MVLIKRIMSEYIYRLKVNDISFRICESSRMDLNDDELVLSLFIKCGTFNEEVPGSQIAHLLEHINLSFNRFNLDKEKCKIHGETNFNYTMYTFGGKKQQIDYFFDKIEDILCGKYINQKYLNKAVQDIIDEYYNIFLKKSYCTNKVNRAVLDYYNLTEYLPNNRIDLITSLTVTDIFHFKEKWYTDRNTEIFILVPNNKNIEIKQAITAFCKKHKNSRYCNELPYKNIPRVGNQMVRIEGKVIFLLSGRYENYNKTEIILKIIILSMEMSDCKKYIKNFDLCTIANKYYYIVADFIEDVGMVEQLRKMLIKVIEGKDFSSIICNILYELKSSQFQITSKIDVDFYLQCFKEDALFFKCFNGFEYKQWQYYQIINSITPEEINKSVHDLFNNMEVRNV